VFPFYSLFAFACCNALFFCVILCFQEKRKEIMTFTQRGTSGDHFGVERWWLDIGLRACFLLLGYLFCIFLYCFSKRKALSENLKESNRRQIQTIYYYHQSAIANVLFVWYGKGCFPFFWFLLQAQREHKQQQERQQSRK
jgi:hypothetical protein